VDAFPRRLVSASTAGFVVVAVAIGCSRFDSSISDSTATVDGGDGGNDAPLSSAEGGGFDPSLPLSGDPGVVCGARICDVGTVCCGDISGCIPASDAAACDLALACDDGIDCPYPGRVCCAQLGSDRKDFISSACRTMGECQKTLSPAIPCTPEESRPCPNGAACVRLDGGARYRCEGLP
jgi:hypothetical protein